MNSDFVNFQVSVITPVYNAEKYVRKAVESAVSIEEVGEVILIEDFSPDNSLAVCRQLEEEYSKVKLLRHHDNRNHGAGASRNLGIKNASFDYVAFLDADDFFLLNRFKKDKEILLEHDDIDGVYNAIGIQYYTEIGRKAYLNTGQPEVMSVSGPVPPDELIFVLLWSHPDYQGSFHTDTITVRKQLFDKVGLFNEELRLQQDTHMWKRMAAVGKLAPGNIEEPVAIRGVHDQNRMINAFEQKKYYAHWWADLNSWFKRTAVDRKVIEIFEQQYCEWKIRNYPSWKKGATFLTHVFKHPELISREYEFFDLNLFHAFGRNWLTLHLVSAKNRLFRKMKGNFGENTSF